MDQIQYVMPKVKVVFLFCTCFYHDNKLQFRHLIDKLQFIYYNYNLSIIDKLQFRHLRV